MHTSTKKWLFTKISSLILIPLMIWFLLNFVSLYDQDYFELLNFFTQQPAKILFSVFKSVTTFVGIATHNLPTSQATSLTLTIK